MVKSFESEHPNLSFVHINQATSAGSDEFKRGYITNGLQRTDSIVVNAELVPKSLTAPALPEPIVVTPYWDLEIGSSEVVVASAAKFKNGPTQASHGTPLDSSATGRATNDSMDITPAGATGANTLAAGAGDSISEAGALASGVDDPASGAGDPASGAGNLTSGAGDPASGAGNLTSGAGDPALGAWNLTSGAGDPASGAGNQTSGAGNLASGAGNLTSGAGNLASGAGDSTSAIRKTTGTIVSTSVAGKSLKYTVVVADNSSRTATVPGKSTVSLNGHTSPTNGPSFAVAKISVPDRGTSAKRPRLDCQSVESQNTPRTVGPQFVVKTTPSQLVQENRRLESENADLREKNMQLQEKLDLLGAILRDPRKRELLHARLQMHPAIKKNQMRGEA